MTESEVRKCHHGKGPGEICLDCEKHEERLQEFRAELAEYARAKDGV